MSESELLSGRMPPMPVLAGLLDVFGLTQEQLSKLVGVPQPKLSKWYRGQGIEAEYVFLLTATLELVIEAAEEGQTSEDLPLAARRSLELRSQTARQWLALQHELNEQLPQDARQHARALEERLSEARRAERLQAEAAHPQKRGTRPTAGKHSGSGSVRCNTPTRGASGE